MVKANDHKLTKLLITAADVITADLVFLYFRNFHNTNMPLSLIYGSKTAIIILSLSIIMVSLIMPPVLHFRRISMEEITKRNIKFVMAFTWLFIITCRLMTRSGHYVHFGVQLTCALTVAFILLGTIERLVLGKFRSIGKNTKTVLFIGCDPAILMVYNQIISDPSTGYRVIGYFSDGVIEDAPEGLPKLGSAEDFRQIVYSERVLSMQIDELFCSISHDKVDILRGVINFCNRNMTHFFYVPRIFPNIQMSLHPEILGDSVVYTNYCDPLQQTSNRMLKYTFDFVMSAIVLICLLPFIPIIAFIIKRQSPGSIFFVQERTGYNGKPFKCYKFRSMHINDESDKAQATKDDPRKFPFGDFMRRTNIDELPQFFNVLKGEMSIVGPRPHMLYHTDKYSAIINKYMVRHVYRPGITGLAQATGFRGETEELWQMEERIRKDIWYIEHWSMWLDIKIMLMTAWSIIRRDEAAY